MKVIRRCTERKRGVSLDVLGRHTQTHTTHTHIGSCKWDRGTKVRSTEGAEKVGDVGNLVCRRRVVVSDEIKQSMEQQGKVDWLGGSGGSGGGWRVGGNGTDWD